MESTGIKPTHIRETLPDGVIMVGQRWTNTINGNTIHVLERTHRKSWVVRETAKGSLRLHDEGQKELREEYILEFFRQL